VTVGSDWDIIWSDNNGDDFLKVDETNDALVLGSTGGTTEREVNFAGKVGTNITFDGTAGRTLTNAQTMTVSTTGANLLTLSSGGALDVDGAGIVSINSSAAAINVGNDAIAQNINVGTAGARTISIGSGDATEVQIDADLIDLNSDGAVTVDSGSSTAINATTTLDLDAAGIVSINSSAAAINVGDDAIAQNINVGTAGARTITIGSAGATEVQIDADLIDLNSDGAFTIDGASASTITATGATLSLATTGANELDITSGGALDLNGAVVTIDGSTSVAIDSAGTTLLDSTTGTTVDSGALTVIDSTTGTTVKADAGGVDITATAGDIDITAPAASDLNLVATSNAASDITFQAHGSNVTEFNSATAGETDLNAELPQNIVGAINSIYADIAGVTVTYLAAEAITAGDLVAFDAGANAVWQADQGTAAVSRAVGVAIDGNTTGNPVEVALAGEVASSSTLNAADVGEYVYMNANGAVSTTPGAAVVQKIGVISAADTLIIQIGTRVSL